MALARLGTAELDAILAVVIGGTALTGGRFYLFGSIVGALLIQTLTTTMYARNVSADISPVPKALVVIAVCLLQSEQARSFLRRLFLRRIPSSTTAAASPASAVQSTNHIVNRINPKYIPLAATAIVLLALYGVGCARYDNFGSLRVIVNLFGDNAFIGIAAVGATFVILSGGIDLSVGAVIAFIGIFVAAAIYNGIPPAVAIPLALVIGIVFGAVQGGLIRYFALPPFLVTLGGMFLMRGLAFVVRDESLAINHSFYQETLYALAIPLMPRVALPFTAVCLIAVVIAATYIAAYTRLGRSVYAIGSSENSALLMGVPVGSTKIGIYAIAGLFSAFAGCVSTFYMQSGNPASFVGLEFDAIASVVIGGTLLTGGVGFIPGTLMGVLILGLIQTLITFEGTLDTWWTKIAVGTLLLLFIVLQKSITATSRRA